MEPAHTFTASEGLVRYSDSITSLIPNPCRIQAPSAVGMKSG